MKTSYKFLFNTLKPNDVVVAAISGGPDSMALIYILIKIKKELNIKIICAHVHHNTGRIGQDEEQSYVKELCEKNSIIFETLKIKEYKEKNFENEARTIRYNFFEELIKKYSAKYLLTAHHGDDLVETILMRIDRGSTLKGYSGFSEVTKRDNYTILRPFIYITKKELLKYNEENNIKYYIDNTNLEDDHTRNRYRKYILDNLKKENKNIHKSYYNFSKTLIEYDSYVKKQIDNILPTIYQDKKINLIEFVKLDKFLQDKVLYNILEDVYKNKIGLLNKKHISEITKIINSKKVNTYINLPNNIILIKEYESAKFKKEELVENYKYEFNKKIDLPNGKTIEQLNTTTEKSNFVLKISSKEIKLPLYIRTKEDGDIIEIKGLNGHKKVKDIFINEKIEKEKRLLWPIVTDSNNTIIWIPGLKKSKFDKTFEEFYDIILKYN